MELLQAGKLVSFFFPVFKTFTQVNIQPLTASLSDVRSMNGCRPEEPKKAAIEVIKEFNGEGKFKSNENFCNTARKEWEIISEGIVFNKCHITLKSRKHPQSTKKVNFFELDECFKSLVKVGDGYPKLIFSLTQ